MRLVARGAYDLPRSLARIVCPVVATRHPARGKRSAAGPAFPLRADVGGSPALVEVGQTSADQVEVRSLAGPGGEALARAVERQLSLDRDWAAFERAVEHDLAVRWLVRAGTGVRPVLAPSPFEGLVRAVVFQQVSYPAAETVAGRLATRFGTAVLGPEGPVHAVPGPEALARLAPPVLREVGLSPRKAATLHDLARRVVGGELDLAALAADGDPEAAEARLREVPGVGPWTAHQALIRGLGFTDVLPTGEPGLGRLLADLEAELGLPPSEVPLAERARGWRPWRTWVAWLIWERLMPI